MISQYNKPQLIEDEDLLYVQESAYATEDSKKKGKPHEERRFGKEELSGLMRNMIFVRENRR